ncbi:MAG: L,D-transpeptidase family protein [Planctomycetes bacterium]|nr:L,D-transpeptidase family protein [Planctomycetota bacterium]
MKIPLKSLVPLGLGLLIGVLSLWAFQLLNDGGDGTPVVPQLVGESSVNQEPVSPGTAQSGGGKVSDGRHDSLTPGRLSTPGRPAPISSPVIASSGVRTPPRRPLALRGPVFGDEVGGSDPRNSQNLSPSESPLSGQSAVPRFSPERDLQKKRELATAAFDADQPALGARILRQVYVSAKSNASMDLTPEVERLLFSETRYPLRYEYSTYLAARGASASVFRSALGNGEAKVALALSDQDAALDAWSELSLAYELAPDDASRVEVLQHLSPFLDRLVFAGKTSPLLKRYSVKQGDNLSAIASRTRATVLSIRRLNRLSNDVIRPGQRLNVLSGRVRIYVDKSEYRLWATIDDRFLMEFDVGLGRENATPIGEFVIDVKETNPSWWRPGEGAIPAGDPRNILGTRWMGFKNTDDYSGFGIHGTDIPESIGEQASAGCVRLRNGDIEKLYDFVPYQTVVVVRN